MNQIKILGCGLLIGLGLSVAAPQCHADYVNLENASVITSDDGLFESFGEYSFNDYSSAIPNGSLGAQRMASARGHLIPNSHGEANVRPIEASATSEWKWVGGGQPTPLTLVWNAGYIGGLYYGGNGAYSTSVSMTGSQTGLSPANPTAVDDWVLDSSGGVSYAFQSQAASTNGDGADFNFVGGEQRSYPSAPTPEFTLTTYLKLESGVSAGGVGETSLSEIADLFVEVGQ